MNRALHGSIAVMILMAACGTQPGSFTLSFSWDPQPEDTVWIWVRVEERSDPAQAGRILASAGPASYEVDGWTELELEDVPNGSDRYVIVEAREGKNKSLPILYYGISSPFTISPGKNTEVDVHTMKVPEALAVDAVVALEFDGKNMDIVGEALLRNATVVLESAHAVSVMLAGDAGISENVLELSLQDSDVLTCEQEEREGLTWSICRYAGWDLAAGLEGELLDQQYTVFVKFLDQYGYESQVYRASAILDSLAPQVVLGSITPVIAGPGSDVYLNVSFHEGVAVDGGLALHVEPDLPADSSVSEPQLLGSSTTCLWVISLAEDWTGGEESYIFTVDTADALGNKETGLEVLDGQQEPLSLRIDDQPPTLVAGAEATFSSTLFGLEQVGTVFTFSFAVEEVNPQEMTQGADQQCMGLCPVVRIGNASPGTVLRNTDNDLPEHNVVAFTYEYEVQEEDFATKDSTPQVSISWSDVAGNTLEEILPGELHFDFQAPRSVSCSLMPGKGNVSSLFIYKVTASETLAETPELVVQSDTPLFQDPPEITDGGLTFRWEQSGAALDSQSFTVGVNMTDEAGNSSEGLVCSQSAQVDGEMPVVDIYAQDLALWTVPEVLDALGTPLLTLGDAYELHVSVPVEEDGEMADGYPDVRLAVPGDAIMLDQVSATQTGEGKWLYEYAVAISKDEHGDASGLWPVQVTLLDEAGNQSVTSALGDQLVTIDLIPPTATCKAVPLQANMNSTITVTVTPSEQLNGNPTVLHSDIEFEAPSYDPLGNSYEYSHPIGLEDEDTGEWTFSVALTDLVGNASEGVSACETGGTVDAKAPWMEDAALWTDPEVTNGLNNIVLAAGDQDALYLSFVAGDDLKLAADKTHAWLDAPGPTDFELVQSIEQQDGAIAYTWKLTLDGALNATAEGTRTVALYLEDDAGNPASFNSILDAGIRVDFTPPTADCALLPVPGPGGYGIDRKVTLLVSPVEELSTDAPPLLAESDVPGADAFFTFEEGSAYRFNGVIGEWDDTGSFSASVSLVDLVGNETPLGADACSTPTLISYDAVPPAVEGGAAGIALSKSLVMNEEEFHVTFALTDSEELPTDPLLTVGGRNMAKSGGPPDGEYDYSYAPDSGGEPPDTEGIWPLSLTLEDGAGNTMLYSPGTVQFDFSKPQLSGTPGVQMVPPEDCPLYSVDALGAGAALEVTFAVGEILEQAPVVWYEGDGVAGTVQMAPVGTAEPDQFAYTFRLSAVETVALAEGVEGTGSIVAQVTDLAGNAGELTVVEEVAVDTLAPQAPDVATEGRVIYSRMPWGSDATDGSKAFFLRGEAGAVESGAHVRVYDSEDPSSAMFLGQATTTQDGAFGSLPGENGAFKLVAVDLPQVFVEAIDTACNSSSAAGAATMVRDVEWVATMGHKEAESTAANPNEFKERPWFVNSLWWNVDGEPEEPVVLATAGDGEATTSGASDWTVVETDWQDLPIRAYASIAYDSWRDRIVLFGGQGEEGELNDTWEYDGFTWTQVVPEDPEGDGDPATGFYVKTAMAFDSTRGKTVLFNGHTKQTWEWDGASWAHRIPSDPEEDGDPKSLNSASMVFFPELSAVVLVLQTGNLTLWTWTGHSWLLLEATDPLTGDIPGRISAAVAYDPNMASIVVWGGVAGMQERLGDTWAWDGSDWHDLTPAAPNEAQPEPAEGAAMAYDLARGEMLLFGGIESDVGSTSVSGKLWKWTGSEWSLLEDNPNSIDPHKPGRSQRCSMIYDERRELTVLVGGKYYVTSGYNEGTYEWLGDQWEHRFDDGMERAPLHAGPSCYSASREVVFSFYPGYGTWQWDLSGWHEVSSAVAPGGRMDWSIVCDDTNDRVLLFGGSTGMSPFNDLWEWDFDEWTMLHDSDDNDQTIPSPRRFASMVHDPSRDVVVLFGGAYSIGGGQKESVEDTTWELDGDQWTFKTFDGPDDDPEGDGEPSGRMLANAVHFPADGRMHFLNGSYAGAQYNVAWHDHWAYDGTSWAHVESDNQGPEAHSKADRITWQVFVDPELQELVMVGANAPGMPNEPLEIWRWNGAAWTMAQETDATGDGRPSPRAKHSMNWYEPLNKALLFGGQLYNGSSSRETWFWDNGTGQRPAHVLRVSLAESGITDQTLFTALTLNWHAGGNGTVDEVATSGARLLVWDGGTFAQMDTNDSPTDGATALTWSTSDDALLERVPVTDDLIVGAAVTPVGTNWTEYATISSSYVEVVLSYRLEQ